MYVYNTTFLVKNSRFEQWREFIDRELTPLFTDELGFSEPTLMRIHCPTEEGHTSFAYQIKAQNMKQIERWQTLYETPFKNRLFQIFGEEALPFSTIMEII